MREIVNALAAVSPEQAVLAAVFLPFIGAVLAVLAGRSPNFREFLTLLTSVLTFGAVLKLAADGLPPGEIVLVQMLPGLDVKFAAEPLGLVFALIASGLWIVASLYSIGYMRGNREHNQTSFYAWFAVSIGSALGLAFSGNLLTLFVFYEVLTVATYPLVTHAGTEEAKAGGRTYLGLLLGTSILFLLLAIVWTYVLTDTLDFAPGGILAGHAGPGLIVALLVLYMYGIGKAALMPLHSWLPAAMVAPTPVSALLHAVAVVKAGVFTVVKVIVYIFGVDLLVSVPGTEWLAWVAGFTVIAASLVALTQDNLKKRLAYSTVSQLSYVVLAAAVLTPLAIAGAVLHIVAHAFGKITLFFGAGAIATASGKKYISQLDGIGRRMPWTMGAFAVAVISMIGLPPTAGFISKWYILQGAIAAEHALAVTVLVLSTLLNTAYFVPIVYRAFFRAPPEGSTPHGEAPFASVLALTVTAALTLAFFIWPGAFLALAQQVADAGTGGSP
ncbi:MAG: monovalent cation/H+ antiporter subunit D family protein [Alphaproteobacteria bacterium]